MRHMSNVGVVSLHFEEREQGLVLVELQGKGVQISLIGPDKYQRLLFVDEAGILDVDFLSQKLSSYGLLITLYEGLIEDEAKIIQQVCFFGVDLKLIILFQEKFRPRGFVEKRVETTHFVIF